MRFESRGRRAWQRIAIGAICIVGVGLIVFSLFRPGLTWIGVGLIAASLLLENERGVLVLEQDRLTYSNQFVSAEADRNGVTDAKLRRDPIFGRQLVLTGSFIVHLRSGKSRSRSALTVSAVGLDLEEARRAIVDWKAGR